MKERSFSLLELLLVMSIIAILASFVASSASKARLQAQKVACRVAIRSYAVEVIERSGGLLIVIPQEANCHECHMPRYNAGLYLDQLVPWKIVTLTSVLMYNDMDETQRVHID